MKRFKNILLLYNGEVGTETTLSRAQSLAKNNDARLTLVEVIQRMPGDVMALLGPLPRGERDVQDRYIAERQAHLERLAISMRRDGATVDVRVLRGTPFLEVIRAVLRDGHDLVVMTADSWQGLRKFTFGSTSMHLMRKCPCPVWVMKPKAVRRFHRILAAVDPGLSDGPPPALDVKILEMASSLARMEDCSLDIVNAWEFSGGELDTSRSEITEEVKQSLLAKNETARRESLQRLIEGVDLSGLTVDIHVPRGKPNLLIPEIVSGQKIDLIVMGTATRTGIAGFLIGTTAEDVLRQVDCSVLTVKPDGFVSPVTLDA